MPTALASDLASSQARLVAKGAEFDGGAVVNAQIKPTKNPGAFAPGSVVEVNRSENDQK